MATSPNTNVADQIIARCRHVATFTEIPGQTTRTFLSPAMHDVHAVLRQWMLAAGMSVYIDAIGNIRGLYPGPAEDSPRLIIASHLDTVPNAGVFDGPLGVLLGLALIEHLHTAETKLPFAIELIGFSEEEGVRFAKPFLGSLALTGQLTTDDLACEDSYGITIADAITRFGLNPADLPQARLSPQAFAYLEFHIEQGPVLESQSFRLGVVTAVLGQTRQAYTFTGQANHAGTTPMHLRHDALAAAAAWITEVERFAKSQNELVATVGKLEALPGAGNVIAGKVTATLDVRHVQNHIREQAVQAITEFAQQAAKERGVKVVVQTTMEQPAILMDAHLTTLLQIAANNTGNTSRSMVSGAGHDAMVLASHIPSALLFLRSPGGLSHHPDESVHPGDVEAAVITGLEFLSLLRDQPSILK
jgi:allantoate deiminase